MQKIKVKGGVRAGLPENFHFHGDYLVIGCSYPGLVQIWNIKTGEKVWKQIFLIYAIM